MCCVISGRGTLTAGDATFVRPTSFLLEPCQLPHITTAKHIHFLDAQRAPITDTRCKEWILRSKGTVQLAADLDLDHI